MLIFMMNVFGSFGSILNQKEVKEMDLVDGKT